MNPSLRDVIDEVVKATPAPKSHPPKKPRAKTPPKEKTPKGPRVYNVPEHGTAARYQSQRHRCRCQPCKDAYSKSSLRQRTAKRQRFMENGYEGVKHGTVYGYNTAGCRCALCLEATRISAARKRRNNGARVMPQTTNHGTNARYNLGCRCEKCKISHKCYMRDYRKHGMR